MSIELKDKLVTLESLGVVYNSEVNDRNAAISAEATARAEAISAETAARTEAIANEVTARNAAIVEAINQAETGAPTKVELVSQMTDPDKNYLYIGEEQGYNSGHIYYLVDGVPVDKGVFGGTNIDDTLTISGQAADAKVTGDKIEEIKEDLSAIDSTADYNYTGTGETGAFITAANKWSISSVVTTLVFRIPKNTRKIKVTASNAQTAIIAFLRSYNPVSGETPDWASGYKRITIPEGENVTYDVASDMVYMYVYIFDTSHENHTPTLTFTYPADLPLEALDDTSDRSTEINLLLEIFGKCILGKGTYYVSGVVMPDSTALIGTSNSVVYLLDSVTSGSAITMSKNSLVQGIYLNGGMSSVGITEGSRYGIEWTGDSIYTGLVDNCIIRGFDGAGILLHDTTVNVYRNLFITNCRIRMNYIGIDIKKNSEFNRITGCNIKNNYYGIRNRGGNNHVDNCGIDSNTIGVQVDADEGSNNGHGGISNCTINHSGSNNGYGIIIKNTGRMLVNGCNLYYSKILLDNTNGNIINACGFGNNAGWEITDGECNMFTNCMIRSASDTPITIINNTQTKIVNCYTRDGAEVTA